VTAALANPRCEAKPIPVAPTGGLAAGAPCQTCKVRTVSFRFVSFRFVSFRFVSFHFVAGSRSIALCLVLCVCLCACVFVCVMWADFALASVQIVRPMRSVHCSMQPCNDCVARYDHHSPWINACVGAHNQVMYTVYLVFGFQATLVAFIWALAATISPAPQAGDPWAGLAHMFVIVIAPLSLVYTGAKLQRHFSLVSANITAHEDRSKRRLTYFRGKGGFSNPFDKGAQANWMEFLGYSSIDWRKPQGYTVMDLPGHPLRTQVLNQVRTFMRAQEEGKQLQVEQARMVEMCRHMIEQEDVLSATAEAVKGEVEVKHSSVPATSAV